MHIDEIREYCVNLPVVTEGFPFDNDSLVFKVMGKMFALIPLEKGSGVSLKCDPERAIELRAEWEEIEGAYHMSKKHWNMLDLNGRLPRDLVWELVMHSYNLVVKKLKKADREKLEALK